MAAAHTHTDRRTKRLAGIIRHPNFALVGLRVDAKTRAVRDGWARKRRTAAKLGPKQGPHPLWDKNVINRLDLKQKTTGDNTGGRTNAAQY